MAANDYFPDLPDTEDVLDAFAQHMANRSFQPVHKLKGGNYSCIEPDFDQINAEDEDLASDIHFDEDIW